VVKKILKWVLILVFGFFLGFPVAMGIGNYIPERYKTDKSKSFNYSSQIIWETLTDIKSYPKWKPNVKKVELLGRNEAGLLEWKEYYTNKKPITYQITNQLSKKLLEISISDETSPLQGTWVYRLTEHRKKGILQVKQYAIIKKPYYRFEAKYIHGHKTDVDKQFYWLNKRLKQIKKEKQPPPEEEEEDLS